MQRSVLLTGVTVSHTNLQACPFHVTATCAFWAAAPCCLHLPTPNHHSTLCFYVFDSLRFCLWDRAAFVCQCLAYGTQHRVLPVHPCWQDLLPSKLSDTPLYVCTVPTLTNTEVVSTPWLLWRRCSAQGHRHLLQVQTEFPLCIYSEVELLAHEALLFLVFWEASTLSPCGCMEAPFIAVLTLNISMMQNDFSCTCFKLEVLAQCFNSTLFLSAFV